VVYFNSSLPTPLKMERKNGHNAIVEYLRSKGGKE
jgi:hypothetical protein